MPPCCREHLREMLEFTDSLLTAHSVPHILFHGSALGAVKYGGVIPYEVDADVLFNESHIQTVASLLPQFTKAGYFYSSEPTKIFPGYHYIRYGAENNLFMELVSNLFPEKELTEKYSFVNQSATQNLSMDFGGFTAKVTDNPALIAAEMYGNSYLDLNLHWRALNHNSSFCPGHYNCVKTLYPTFYDITPQFDCK